MTRLTALCAAAVALLALAPAMAFATPGDDSTSGWMPSSSPPAFDDRAEIKLGEAALKAERYQEAEAHFDHVLQDIPKNEDATFLRGLCRKGRGDIDGARDAFVRTLLLNRDNLFAHFELGMLYVRVGRIADADDQYYALERQARLCGRRCPDGPYISRAILTLGSALDAARRRR
jgi:Flp pilus assembly protein TadD